MKNSGKSALFNVYDVVSPVTFISFGLALGEDNNIVAAVCFELSSALCNQYSTTVSTTEAVVVDDHVVGGLGFFPKDTRPYDTDQGELPAELTALTRKTYTFPVCNPVFSKLLYNIPVMLVAVS